MGIRRCHLAAVSAATVMVVLLGGCGAAPSTAEAATSPEVATESTAGSMSDADVCTAFGDVLTIVENADLGLRGGRMDESEQLGWYQLATRVLGRLSPSGTSAVSQAIGELQAIAPAVPPGAQETVDIGSPEWASATERLYIACEEVGVELTIQVFTGG
ncbi:hypothetical protein [Occultella kanbiaonis]|uniref:hypothetical protein n=1 Tax=Occultella kanbiaonis TaxID=2675754 RepID=UPI0013D295BD|nr:hypothetical protein [Occultella kanbiaonis]